MNKDDELELWLGKAWLAFSEIANLLEDEMTVGDKQARDLAGRMMFELFRVLSLDVVRKYRGSTIYEVLGEE